MQVSPLVKDALEVNDRMNRVLLETLDPTKLSLTTPDNRWSVAGYLAHLVASKKWWISHVDEAGAAGLPDLFTGTEGRYVAEKDVGRIKAVFEQTSRTLLETAERAEDKGTLPYASTDHYLLHMIVHDAHHRGQIVLVLRGAGYEPPDEDTFWGGWWPEQAPDV